MPEVYPGTNKYRFSQKIPRELGSDAARRGDALAVGASGTAVRTTGSNGFLGVLAQATQADAAADALGPGVDDAVLAASGDTANVAIQGVVRAKVSAFDSGTGGTVSDGDAIEAARTAHSRISTTVAVPQSRRMWTNQRRSVTRTRTASRSSS